MALLLKTALVYFQQEQFLILEKETKSPEFQLKIISYYGDRWIKVFVIIVSRALIRTLKTGNQRLDRLIDSLSTVAKMPRNLTVQSPNPVDDAPKIMNDFSTGQVVAAEL